MRIFAAVRDKYMPHVLSALSYFTPTRVFDHGVFTACGFYFAFSFSFVLGYFWRWLQQPLGQLDQRYSWSGVPAKLPVTLAVPSAVGGCHTSVTCWCIPTAGFPANLEIERCRC